jgi:hypothetical protein
LFEWEAFKPLKKAIFANNFILPRFWNPTHFFYGHKGSQIASLVVFQLREQF